MMLKDKPLMWLSYLVVNLIQIKIPFLYIIFFLGDKGTKTIGACKKSGALLLEHYKTKKLVAAICAGPIAISTHLHDADENARQHDITCYPEAASSLKNKFKSINLDKSVVHSEVNDHHLITSQGPATAIEFGLQILSRLTDKKKADEIRQKVLA